MILNPRPRPDGISPSIPSAVPSLNPEISKWFHARQSQLKAVKTTRTPSGQILDWVPIESQYTHGKIATAPPPLPLPPTGRDLAAVRFELHGDNAERGPAGTVPILRKSLAALHETRSLKEYLSKRGGSLVNRSRRNKSPADPVAGGYFHVISGQSTNQLYGCEGWLNVWNPYVETSTDHSIMQCGLQNYDNPQLQSLEAGWTVDQSLNGDWLSHLFTYYTTNGYSQEGDNLGGYNTDVDGWVQYNSNVYPGAVLDGISTQGGPQFGFSLKYQLWQENWWFAAQGIWLGYYPASLFTGNRSVFGTLGAYAEWLGFWGEVYSALADPFTSRTQMGSGARAEAGWTYACFQKNLSAQIDTDGGMSA
jgi:hypothetical protein